MKVYSHKINVKYEIKTIKYRNCKIIENLQFVGDIRKVRSLKIPEFWLSQDSRVLKISAFFLKKWTYTNARTPLPLFVFVRFSMTPSPSPSPQRTYFLNDTSVSIAAMKETSQSYFSKSTKKHLFWITLLL